MVPGESEINQLFDKAVLGQPFLFFNIALILENHEKLKPAYTRMAFMIDEKSKSGDYILLQILFMIY